MTTNSSPAPGIPASGILATSFPATYSRLIVRELQLDEAGQQVLLEGTSLTPAMLFSLDEEVKAEDQFTILRNALKISGDPALGLQWGSHLYATAHGALGQISTHCGSLLEGLQATARYADLRGRFVDMSLEQDGDWLVVHMKSLLPMDDVGLFFMEALLQTTQHNIELVIGRDFNDGEIWLGYPAPAHGERYADYLHSPFRFDAASTCMRIPAALAAMRNPFSDQEAFRETLRRCEQIREALRQRGGWRQRVSALLAAHPGQLWTQQEVANHIGLSVRTLIRHLKAEGTSYQAILDEELGRQAQSCLASPRYTVEAVALTLGYHDVSAFRRAFKRWFGISPAEYKQQLQSR